jgi:diguanylate cyclase (GGDEF)-like protein
MYDPIIVDTFIDVYRDIAPDMADPLMDRSQRPSVLSKHLTVAEERLSGSSLDNIAASAEETLVLYDLARSLVGDLDLGTAAGLIASQTRRIVPASTCVIYAYDTSADELRCVHAAGENASNSDPVLDLGEAARLMKPRLRSCLSTPLLSNADLIGVLTLYSPHADSFTEDHRRIIEAVARQVSPMLRQTTAGELGPKFQMPDRLAGLPNKQQLRRFIEAEISMEGARSPLSLILVSVMPVVATETTLDDTAREGLARVTDAIRSVLREGDILFRCGEGELVVLLTQTDVDTALAALARIAATVSDSLRAFPKFHRTLQTLALGCASAPRDGVNADELLEGARRRTSGSIGASRLRPPSIH